MLSFEKATDLVNKLCHLSIAFVIDLKFETYNVPLPLLLPNLLSGELCCNVCLCFCDIGGCITLVYLLSLIQGMILQLL